MFRVTLEELNDAGIVVESVSFAVVLEPEESDEVESAIGQAFAHCATNFWPGMLQAEKIVSEFIDHMQLGSRCEFRDSVLSELIDEKFRERQSMLSSFRGSVPEIYNREQWVYVKKQGQVESGDGLHSG